MLDGSIGIPELLRVGKALVQSFEVDVDNVRQWVWPSGRIRLDQSVVQREFRQGMGYGPYGMRRQGIDPHEKSCRSRQHQACDPAVGP